MMKGKRGLAYLDTNALLDMIGYGNSSRRYQWHTNKALYDYTIKIPQAVLGEAAAVILRDRPDLQDIHAYVDRIDAVFGKATFDPDRFPPVSNRVIEEALELSRVSDVVNNMDALILAHAIVDNNATHFFTIDESLRNERVIGRLKLLRDQGIRNRDLTILAEWE